MVRARSYRSQRKNEDPWKVQVELRYEAEIKVIKHLCTCEAGRGVCSHIIGLFYLLAHYKSLGLTSVPPSVSKTSIPQTWHVPQRTHGIFPREITDVVIQKVKPPQDCQAEKKLSRVDGVHSTLYNPIQCSLGDIDTMNKLMEATAQFPDIQINTVLSRAQETSLTSCFFGNVAQGSFLSYQQRVKKSHDSKVHIVDTDAPEPPEFNPPIIAQSFVTAFTDSQQNYLDGLKVSSAQTNAYEKETRCQSKQALWHELKSQRLSSSKFKDVCCRQKDFESLAKRLVMKKNIQTQAMKYGLEHEEAAAECFVKTFNLNVYPCGIIINPSCPHLASSPDRRVYDPSEENPWGLLEIKCPVKSTILDLPYLKETDGILKLKDNHEYYYQIMGQMLVTGAEWVDFYVWCADDFHSERIRIDSDFQHRMKDKLDMFYFEYLLPNLMIKPLITLT